jgi:hypothetical protein
LRQGSDVAARSRQARDQADPNRVVRQSKDDRDTRCRLLGRDDRASSRDNYIDVAPDEFGCDLGKPLAAALCPAIFDRKATYLQPEGVLTPGNPITGIAGCCACAASGQTAAAPSVAKNFRRPMQPAM